MNVKVFAIAILFTLSLPSRGTTQEKYEEDIFLSLTRTPLVAREMPTNTTVINQEDMDRTNAANLGDLLQQTTPIQIQESGILGNLQLPQLRGFFSKGVAIFIDDRRVPADATGSVDLSKIPLDNVDRVEIVRGAGSVLYGPDTQGGIIHVRTKRPRAYTPSSRIDTEFGSFNTQIWRGHYGAKYGRVETLFSGSEGTTDGFQDHSKARTTATSGLVAYDFQRWGRTSVNAQHTDGYEELSGGTNVPLNEWDGKKERLANSLTDFKNTGLYTAQLEHVYTARSEVKLTGRLAATNSRIDGENFGPFDNKVRNRSAYVQMDLPMGFTSAYEYLQDCLDSLTFGSDKTNTWAVFAQQRLTPGNWMLLPALRYDKNTDFGDTTNPRFSLVHKTASWLKISGNIGRSFRTPTFADRLGLAAFGTPPSPDVKPEVTWQYDVGTELKSKTSRLTLTFYRNDSNDLILHDPVDFRAFNINKAFSQGVEVDISQQLSACVHHGMSYAYLQNKGQQAGSSTFVPLRFSPKHKSNYWVNVTTPFKFSILNSLEYVDEQFTEDDKSGVKLPSYTRWDIRLNQKILDGEVFFRVDNVTDKHYANAGSVFGVFPQPGRTYTFGVSVKFWN